MPGNGHGKIRRMKKGREIREGYFFRILPATVMVIPSDTVNDALDSMVRFLQVNPFALTTG